MKCPKCNGKGKVLDYVAERNCHGEWETVLREIPCDKCQRKPPTNEEWLRSCPPQELIRFLMNVAYSGQIRNVQKRTFDEEAEKWSKWLKEKHTE